MIECSLDVGDSGGTGNVLLFLHSTPFINYTNNISGPYVNTEIIHMQ